MVFVKEVPKLLSDCVSILNHKRSQEKATWKVKYETAKESKELIVADIPLQKFQLYIFSKHYAASNWKEKKSFAQNQRSMMIWKPGKKRKSRTHLKWSYQFPRGLRQTKGAIDRQEKDTLLPIHPHTHGILLTKVATQNAVNSCLPSAGNQKPWDQWAYLPIPLSGLHRSGWSGGLLLAQDRSPPLFGELGDGGSCPLHF